MKKNAFALIGVGGYVAPRHLEAIKKTGNELVAALDTNDSVGILDNFFPQANFFTEFERFDRHIYKLLHDKLSNKIDYISICSPNYLHDSHIRFALRSEANVICEKPLVLNPWNVDGILDLENKTGYKVNTILQLRLHPAIIELKHKVDKHLVTEDNQIELTYITPRGNWYLQSWKGDIKKSGGVATNIGIHFFDILHYLFGKTKSLEINFNTELKSAGILTLEKATIKWFLSIDKSDLCFFQSDLENKTYRSMKLNGAEINFSNGFEDLHLKSYKKILQNKGFGIEETREAINTVSNVKKIKPVGTTGNDHPIINEIKKNNAY